ncbi:STE family protein kinase [Trichomonas vaginalis G3]|uniref:non-specific serine/threonine protein kinase n=1 Tax=Trichomonas vaginalis (strain ATCC PRA-98 / G3) TaxID=412133 RepID=A2FSS2_TRIV3|nr:MAP kinase kinase kinase protein [Trichomonas vaginalis G3]EAX92044.1 STE family protein kinase [Trichomonas vaginalis G3]KAI5485623.1 MAP kinase kinase kinase protein [Trichomonas vaginalis G3]|eukprot:XP_001304974.1 STE family protein kinase [Trichomonas vaginalis G3]
MDKRGNPRGRVENKNNIKHIRTPKKQQAKLPDRFLKKEELGSGAFGVVYAAFDQETSKTVAIKCLINNEAIEDFQEELTLLKRLKHPSIVPYLDSFKDSNGALHIVMEYAENGSLLDVIKTYGPLNEMICSIYVVQILQGLEYLHNQSIIHRDIKAANVLMQGDNCKLADFGLALDLDKYGHTLRESAGSPYWMAPEVINGDPVDTKCDIWSIGATVHELLVGKPPLWDLAPMPAMFQIAGPRDIPIPARFSPDCKEFLQLCLNKNPKLRPDAKQLLAHKWLKKAHEMLAKFNPGSQVSADENMNMKSITARFEALNIWESAENHQPTPDEMCQMLNEDKTFAHGLLLIARSVQTIKRLPQLIQNICGMRAIIDGLTNKQTKLQTLNLIQCIVPYAEQNATSLLLHSVPQKLLFDETEKGDNLLHQQISSMALLFSSSIGPKFCCYSGLVNKVDILLSTPILSLFVPRLLLQIFNAHISGNVGSILLANRDLIKKAVYLAFKACLHAKEYLDLISQKFTDISPIINAPQLNEGDEEKLNVLGIPSEMMGIAKNVVADAISLLHKYSLLSPKSQVYLAEEFDPISYIIQHKEKFPNLTSKEYTTLLTILNNVSSNVVAKEKIAAEELLQPLISQITGSREDDSATILQIVSNMIKNSPELIESACDYGICVALEKARGLVEATVRVRDLVCEIPTVSSFCVWKLKETTLYQDLTDMIDFPIWNRKAIRALSHWASMDSRFISKHLEGVYESINQFIFSELNAAEMKSSHPESFVDVTRIMQYCPNVGHKIYSPEIIERVMTCLGKVGAFGQIQFLEFLIQVIVQSPQPSLIAASLIPQLLPFTQSSVMQVQKAALRVRILSRC